MTSDDRYRPMGCTCDFDDPTERVDPECPIHGSDQ